MEVDVYFEGIKSKIIGELSQATDSIYLAIAWFTDQDLLDVLVEKADSIPVHLVYHDDEINEKLNFDELSSREFGYVYSRKEENLMHHKFCVIGHHTVITGSYNWSYRAQSNEENITIIKGNTQLAKDFISRFKKIVPPIESLEGHADSLDFGKLLQRLTVIKNLVMLEDEESVQSQVLMLGGFLEDEEVSNISSLLQSKQYGQAIESIDFFVQKNQNIVQYSDANIFALRLEIKVLELELAGMSNEKMASEKLILDFGLMNNRRVGSIVKKILEIKMKLAAWTQNKEEDGAEKYEEAKQEYQSYSQGYKEMQEKSFVTLNPHDEKALKKKFRQAALLCHPDKVSDEEKAQAEEIFNQLKEAYDHNDLERVEEILEMLQNKKPFISRSDKYSEKQKLKSEVSRLRFKIEQLAKEIEAIQSSNTYKTIITIDDWDAYFDNAKLTLSKQLEKLEVEWGEIQKSIKHG